MANFGALAVGDHCVGVVGNGTIASPDPFDIVNRSTMQVAASVDGENASILLANGDDMYVEEAHGSQIDRFSLNTDCTVASTTHFPLSPVTTGSSLAWAHGELWFSGQDTGGSTLASLDVGTGTVTTHDGTWGDVQSVPGVADTLWELGNGLGRIDVSSGSPVVGTTTTKPQYPGNWWGVSHDGSKVFVVDYQGPSSVAAVYQYDGWTLAEDTTSYSTGNNLPFGVAVDPVRDRLVTGGYPSGGPQVLNFWSTTDGSRLIHAQVPGVTFPERGVAFSPDGTDLFGVTPSVRAGVPGTLWRFLGDPQPAGLTLTMPHRAVYGSTISVTVHLSATSTNKKVALHEQPVGKQARILGSKTVGSGGSAVFTLKPTQNLALSASWNGDATHLPAATTLTSVSVAPRLRAALHGFYATSGVYHLYHAGQGPLFSVGVAPNRRGQHVMFFVSKLSSGRWRSFRQTTVSLNTKSQSSEIIFKCRPRVHYRVAAVVPGDTLFADATSRAFYFRLT